MSRRRAPLLCLVILVSALLAAAPAGAVDPEVDTTYGWQYFPLVNNTYLESQFLVGNFTGDAASDVALYGPGAEADGLWRGTTGGRGEAAFVKRPMPVNGFYEPIVGDFGGDDHDDILWYAPGPAPDPLWIAQDGPENGFSTSRTVRIDGTYRPTVVRDRTIGSKDAILFYAPGSATDALWRFPDQPGFGDFVGSGIPVKRALSIGGDYQVVAGRFGGGQRDELLFYAPGPAADYLWPQSDGPQGERRVRVDGRYQPVVISGASSDRVYWFASGAAPDHYWSLEGLEPRDLAVVQDPAMVGTAERFGDEGAIVWSPYGRERLITGDANGASSRVLASPAHDITAAVPVMGNFDGDVDGYTDVFWFGRGMRHDELWYGIPSADGTKASPSAAPA